MHKNIPDFFFLRFPAEIQREQMKFNVGNSVSNFLQRNFCAADLRIIGE